MKKLFRKSAIDKLTSLEQLDKSLKVVTPLSWLALVGFTLIIVVVIIWSIKGTLPSTISAKGVIVSVNTPTNTLFSEGSGTVQWIVSNKEITDKESVLRLQDEEGEVKTFYSNQFGVVSKALVKLGDPITQGTEILRIKPIVSMGQDRVAVCYVPKEDKGKISRGLPVQVTLTSADSNTYGHMVGRVINVDERPSENAIKEVGGKDMVSWLNQNVESVCAVTCELTPDGTAKNGYYWSNKKGGEWVLSTQDTCVVEIITETEAPIVKLFAKLRDIWEAK